METVQIDLVGAFAGQTITMRKRISARVLIDLQGDPGTQFAAFEKLVVAHTVLDLDGNPAESILDAPVEAITQAMDKWAAALNTLPNA
jgi:hypothetical protein